MKTDIAYAGQQIPGIRDQQEDCYRIVEGIQLSDNTNGLLCIMCDGMGGHSGGAIASELVVTTMTEYFRNSSDIPTVRRLHESAEAANNAIADRIYSEPALKGMGSTLIAFVVSLNRLYWYSIGDSPLWLLRNSRLTRLNANHSMAALLKSKVEKNEISPEEAAKNSTRNFLLSAVNGYKFELVDNPQTPFFLDDGDQLLAATDGVETLTTDRISHILCNTKDQPVSTALKVLFDELEKIQHPAQDNASTILVRIGPSVTTETLDDQIAKSIPQDKVGPAVLKNGSFMLSALIIGVILVAIAAIVLL
ncbi:PP2C family protein-serine/threonine phosphatase [Desulfosediminicola flagellatus]|uniref:PP2C family protein-serine/threonine phosphatase n=1 Tax=Desulfosediminicola flagellatus TaxID=2569541 RepID=UPI00142EBF87|nr:protein phosphatase 2C domain-containing protein [Desulfosediminicola flagellatus]